MKKIRNKRVIVAMSGGVDSSVAAALLKKGLACPELGRREVVGVFMKFWAGETKKNRCCTPESEKRARLVAEKLGIPFYVFDFSKEFKKKVVDYFLKEYKAGRTPNPCVVCNKEIKFGLLLKKALALNADFIATGHYARVVDDSRQCIFRLYKGRDKNKDQSYFLWQLDQKQLSRILFPVGDYTKPEVRALAKKFKLPIAETPESQEICFVQTTVNNFLKKYIKPRPGKIVDVQGKILGEHQGLWFYTIGQRRGLKISGERVSRSLTGRPFYVLDKDIKRNLLIVTQNEKDLVKKELIAKGVSWILGRPPKLLLKIKAKIRNKHIAASATIKVYKKGRVKLIFSKSQRAVTLGQSVVFYKKSELLGGGIIL